MGASSDVYTLPAKNMEYLLFQRFFAILWGVQGVSVLEIHSYEQMLLVWGGGGGGGGIN